MSRKILVKLIAASFALVGVDAAMACSTAAWTATGGGEVGNPVEGEPDDAVPVARYSGRCGLASSNAASFVRDNSPAGEPKYRARFYVYTGTTAGAGNAVVFNATNASNASMIRVAHDTTANVFNFYVSGNDVADGVVTGVLDNRWYSIELNFSNSAPAELRYTVVGAGGATLANNVATLAAPQATDVIDTAELGWVANLGGTPTGRVNTDAFESRRNTAIGRLPRASSNGDAVCNATDITFTANDILSILTDGAAGSLAPGQPDCDENGQINASDITCTANVIIGDLISEPATVCGV